MTPGYEPVLGNHAWQQPGPGQASSYAEHAAYSGLWGGAGLVLGVQPVGLLLLPDLQASLSTCDFLFKGVSASLRTCFLGAGAVISGWRKKGEDVPSDPSKGLCLWFQSSEDM